MTFYILLSTVAILTTIVGCALIWGYDVARAREIQQEKPAPSTEARLAAARQRASLPASQRADES